LKKKKSLFFTLFNKKYNKFEINSFFILGETTQIIVKKKYGDDAA
jgi:hypothetical protein